MTEAAIQRIYLVRLVGMQDGLIVDPRLRELLFIKQGSERIYFVKQQPADTMLEY